MPTFRAGDPRVDPQLGSGATAVSRNCAVETGRGGVIWASNGLIVPTQDEFRQAAGWPLDELGQPSGLDVNQVALAATTLGVTANVVRGAADIFSALTSGHYVAAAVNYGYVLANAPHLSGDRNYMDGHSVGLFGLEQVRKNGHWWIQWLDPLHDGRRDDVPKQIVMARKKHVEGAMAAMTHGVQAVVFRKAA